MPIPSHPVEVWLVTEGCVCVCVGAPARFRVRNETAARMCVSVFACAWGRAHAHICMMPALAPAESHHQVQQAQLSELQQSMKEQNKPFLISRPAWSVKEVCQKSYHVATSGVRFSCDYEGVFKRNRPIVLK
jgi:hypothetical protein